MAIVYITLNRSCLKEAGANNWYINTFIIELYIIGVFYLLFCLFTCFMKGDSVGDDEDDSYS